MLRTKPDAVCALMIAGRLCVATPGALVADDDPLALARPDLFEPAPEPKKPPK